MNYGIFLWLLKNWHCLLLKLWLDNRSCCLPYDFVPARYQSVKFLARPANLGFKHTALIILMRHWLHERWPVAALVPGNVICRARMEPECRQLSCFGCYSTSVCDFLVLPKLRLSQPGRLHVFLRSLASCKTFLLFKQIIVMIGEAEFCSFILSLSSWSISEHGVIPSRMFAAIKMSKLPPKRLA